MAEEFDHSARREEPKPDCLSKKAVARWSMSEIEKIRQKKPHLLKDQQKLGPYLIGRIAQKALLEGESSNKMLVRAQFPLQAFIRETGHNIDSEERADKAKGLLACLPAVIEVNETWIAYPDGSMIVVNSPSEETLACARFVTEMSSSPEASAILGLSGEDLSSASRFLNMAINSRLFYPLSKKDFSNYMQSRLEQVYPYEAEPTYTINLSNDPIPPGEMIRILTEFAHAPTDTLERSTAAYFQEIAQRMAQKVNEEESRGRASTRNSG